MINVKVVADSINSMGNRLTTIQARYWRAIHAEVMTHRMFSRNASSSRAIPVSTMLKQVWSDPAGPVHWGANQPGMQADAELTGWRKFAAQLLWRISAKAACFFAWTMMKIGVHKQVANRVLEPYQYISVIISATEWDNFFELRDHPDAQPEIQELARGIKKVMRQSVPIQLRDGEWHLPYITGEDRFKYSTETLLKMSVARCARVSYLTHDGQNPSAKKDVALHDKLVGSVPIHASPAEHQAIALPTNSYLRNFRGWAQYRCEVEDMLKDTNAPTKAKQ